MAAPPDGVETVERCRQKAFALTESNGPWGYLLTRTCDVIKAALPGAAAAENILDKVHTLERERVLWMEKNKNGAGPLRETFFDLTECIAVLAKSIALSGQGDQEGDRFGGTKQEPVTQRSFDDGGMQPLQQSPQQHIMPVQPLLQPMQQPVQQPSHLLLRPPAAPMQDDDTIPKNTGADVPSVTPDDQASSHNVSTNDLVEDLDDEVSVVYEGPSVGGAASVESAAPAACAAFVASAASVPSAYVCTLCFQSFTSQLARSTHNCSQRERPATNGDGHRREEGGAGQETNRRLFPCPTCGINFDSKKVMNQHLLLHDGPEPAALDDRYHCDECDRSFSNPSALGVHRTIHSPYRCKICNKRMLNQARLDSHIVRMHGIGRGNVNKKKSGGDAGKKKKKEHKCGECSWISPNRTLLKQHLLRHEGLRLHKCSQCFHTFYTESELKRHLRSAHSIKPYECVRCSEKFFKHTELRQHQETCFPPAAPEAAPAAEFSQPETTSSLVVETGAPSSPSDGSQLENAEKDDQKEETKPQTYRFPKELEDLYTFDEKES